MITLTNGYIKLDTPRTTWLLKEKGGILYNLYYGKRLGHSDSYELLEGRLDAAGGKMMLSFVGAGDFRTPSVLIRNTDGTYVNKFAFAGAEVGPARLPVGVPSAKGGAETVALRYVDEASQVTLVQYLTLYADSDVVTSYVEVTAPAAGKITVESCASLTVDMDGCGYDLYTYTGSWARERYESVHHLTQGVYVNDAKTGSSSPFRNPLLFACRDFGDGGCYAFNLMWSGNHKELAEGFAYDTTRVTVGLSDFAFSYPLCDGETFTTPVATVVRAADRDLASAEMRAFVARHVIPARWQDTPRPIVFNNWEGTYFGFTEEKLLALADRAKELGLELFVLDDGWFGKRNSDRLGLGDWFLNQEKLPMGLDGLSERIHSMGLKFGLWFEPEMVNEDSDLFRSHPEYAMRVPGKEPIRMRHQLMLDMANPAVRAYLRERISYFIEHAKLDYIKWDFNRMMTDIYSPAVEDMGTYVYRYVQGLYELIGQLTEDYPQVLFESCASGGARYDLGLLCYMPQVWCSDNTDARERLYIQEGTLRGYHQSTLSAHVSACPNHQTGNSTSIESRFNVALVGNMGYELDLCALTDQEMEAVKAQVAFYKTYRSTLQYGTLTTCGSIYDGQRGYCYTLVSPDKREAVAVCVWHDTLAIEGIAPPSYRLGGLDPDLTYRITAREEQGKTTELSVCARGDLLCSQGLALGKYLSEADRTKNSGSIRTRAFVIQAL